MANVGISKPRELMFGNFGILVVLHVGNRFCLGGLSFAVVMMLKHEIVANARNFYSRFQNDGWHLLKERLVTAGYV